MISKEEIENNINTEWKIPLESQKKSRYGLCKFIVESCQKMNLSQSTASLAMLITNYFFIKRALRYINLRSGISEPTTNFLIIINLYFFIKHFFYFFVILTMINYLWYVLLFFCLLKLSRLNLD